MALVGVIQLHRLSVDLKLVLVGQATHVLAKNELMRIAGNGGKKYPNSDVAISETTFILSRSDADFLRVECHSYDEVHFSSDRLVFSMPWWRRLFAKDRLQFRIGIDNAEPVLEAYLCRCREGFESLLEPALVDGSSFKFIRLESVAT